MDGSTMSVTAAATNSGGDATTVSTSTDAADDL